MILSKNHFWVKLLLAFALAAFLPVLATAQQDQPRSTSELEKDLRATQKEYKKFKNLSSSLDSSAKQSSNTARKSVIKDFQDFMGECIKRRESDLSEVMTIVQHGEMVKSGTTDVVEVGSKVPGTRQSKFETTRGANSDPRVSQLSNMKSLYIAAKNNTQPAIERQGDSFDRYSDTINKFGQQLQSGINQMSSELDRRAAEAEKAEEEDTAATSDSQ